jgi:anaphase-promoting complex subunit 11
MKVTVTSYDAVAAWKWDLPQDSDDTCGICRVDFEGTCSKCKFPGEECPIGMPILLPISQLSFLSDSSSSPSPLSRRPMLACLPYALHRRLGPVRVLAGPVPHVPSDLPREARRLQHAAHPRHSSRCEPLELC